MFKNFLWAFIEKGGQFSFQLVGVIVMSRFLTPQEYGIYGIMAIFITVSEQLIDSGFGGALVQKKQINQNDINTLFTSNLLISIILYILIFVLAPLVAKIYSINELTIYLRSLGIVIILYAFTIVQETLLQRELKFFTSAKITLASTIISVGGAILIAFYGYGIWSLIIQPILMAFSMAIFTWCFVKRKVSIGFSYLSFRELWNFGSKLLAANLLQTAYSNICTSIIPKISSIRESGLYFQASRINNIPNGILQTTINKASFPILSKKENSNDMLSSARNINRTIYALVLPFFPLLSILAAEVLYIVLGPQWTEGSSYLEILAWGGIGSLIQTCYRNIVKSSGKTEKILFVDITKVLIGLFILACAIPLGTLFLVYGLTASMIIGAVIYSFVVCKNLNFGLHNQISDIIKPLINSVICYLSFKWIYTFLSFNWLNIFLSFAYVFEYMVLAYIVKQKEITTIINKIILKRIL